MDYPPAREVEYLDDHGFWIAVVIWEEQLDTVVVTTLEGKAATIHAEKHRLRPSTRYEHLDDPDYTSQVQIQEAIARHLGRPSTASIALGLPPDATTPGRWETSDGKVGRWYVDGPDISLIDGMGDD